MKISVMTITTVRHSCRSAVIFSERDAAGRYLRFVAGRDHTFRAPLVGEPQPLLRVLTLLALLVSTSGAAQQLGNSLPSLTQSPAAPANASDNTRCLKCHETISALLKKKDVHPAVEIGCLVCHLDHQAAAAKSPQGHYLLSPQPSLCSSCHDTEDKALIAAHRGQPFEKTACTACHNPHASDNPKLIAAHEHPPFAKHQCEKCHQNPQDGKVRLAAASVSELCEGCHTKFQERYEKSTIKHTFLEIDEDSCITCHQPHASGEPKLLKARVTTLCNGCHVDKPGTKKFVHEPARANCAICHDPHSSNYAEHLKADVNTLCTACHGLRPPSQNSQGERLIMPEGFPEKATKIFLDTQNKGHPYLGHPVSGPGVDPQKDKPMSCASCHTAHSGDVVQRFVGELRGNALCLSCHGKK